MLSIALLLLVLFLQETIVNGQDPLQCQHPSQQSGLATIPSVPDFYFQLNGLSFFDDQFLEQLREGFTYIFTIPPTNCSGDVVSIQYCYDETPLRINIGAFKDLFNFMELVQEGAIQYRVIQTYLVQSSPGNRVCRDAQSSSGAMCCDTLTLPPSARFNIPTTNFTYGITVHLSSDLLGFADSIMDVTQIETLLSSGTRVLASGDTLEIPQQPSENPLPLLRFQVETAAVVAAPSQVPSMTPSTSLSEQDDVTAMPSRGPPTSTTNLNTDQDSNNALIIAIAAAGTATVVAVLLLTTVLLIILVCAARKKAKCKPALSDKPLSAHGPQESHTVLTLNQAYNASPDIAMQTNKSYNIPPLQIHPEPHYDTPPHYTAASHTYDYPLP